MRRPVIRHVWSVPAPRQPVPFSHKLHAGDYRIDCQYCHAEARRSAYAGIPSIKRCMGCHQIVGAQRPEVQDLVRDAVLRVNKGLPPAARILRFVNLHKEFDADDEELTRTRKLRRAFLEERYRDVVAGLYSGSREIELDTTITYEDGRVSHSKTTLRVVDAPGV